ncbi:glycosyltransferase family 39 protein [Patescibacteria group bacterium]|nr:glycosyltransferase family 39 protein [Patescibacteria group bacterium]
MSVRKTTLLLFFILLISIILRFYQINENPKAMYGDGLTLVYDAYSILKTGHDQKGNFLPLVFSLGGGRPAGYVYATIPFVVLFGPTALASNMVSILSGIGIVFLLYLLGKEFFSKKVGLAIAAVAALNPWELSLSRGPFETHFALFLTLLGIFSFIKGLKNKYYFLLFGLSFGIASQTYSTFKLTIPLFTLMLLLWAKKDLGINYLKKPLLFISLAIIVASSVLSLYLTISRGNQDRFDIINIFKNPDIRSSVSQDVRENRKLDDSPSVISDILHTKYIGLTSVWVENYVSNYFLSFLFLHGDGQPRHNPTGMGEFFWIDAVLLIVGITYLYKSKRRLLILLSGWILIAPLATSLVGKAHALRSSLLLPPILILVGIGLWKLCSKPRRLTNKLILVFLGFLFLFQFIYFIDGFYFLAPRKNARFWSYPAKQASILVSKNLQKFDFIILSNDIDNMEFAYPVYTKLDPQLVIAQNQSPVKLDEFSFFKYGNVYIGSLPHTRIMQFIKDLPGSVLYIGSNKEQSSLENYRVISGFDGLADLIVVGKPEVPLE